MKKIVATDSELLYWTKHHYLLNHINKRVSCALLICSHVSVIWVYCVMDCELIKL